MFFVFQLPFNVTRVKCTSKISVRLGIGLGLGPKTGKDRTLKKKFRMPSGKRRVHSSRRPLTEFIRRFSEGIHTSFIISDLYRVLTDIAEVKPDITRSVFKCIIPFLP